MSTIKVNSIQDTSGNTQYTAKAWVNFNGTGTVSIRDSGNVSSVTDQGSGDYRVNFINAMADTNYCPTTGFTADSLGNGDNRWPTIITGVSTSYVDVDVSIVANGWNRIDKDYVLVTIYK